MSKNLKKKSESFKKGDIILVEEPFAFLLNSDLRTERCDFCFKRTELKKCSGCDFTYYCGRNCQKSGWEYHKYECSNLKKVAPRVVPDTARMLARIIFKLKNGGAEKASYYSKTKFRVFKDLMSHYNEIKKDEKRLEHFVTLHSVLVKFIESENLPTTPELLTIYGKIVINTYNILDLEMQKIGAGVYLAASVIDHSCTPNAVATFDGPKIIIRTLENIETLDWMKVHISYLDILDLPSERQKKLKSLYYFLCQCKRCLDIAMLNSMTATICQNEHCGRCIEGGALETTLICPHCNKKISEETKEKIMQITEFTKNQIDTMEHLVYLDICEICLRKQENLIHSSNIYKVKILDLAMEGCIKTEHWEQALEYGKQIIEPLKQYYGELHPSRGIFLMKLAKIAALLNKNNYSEKYFKEAISILSVTHGIDNALLREEMLNFMGVS